MSRATREPSGKKHRRKPIGVEYVVMTKMKESAWVDIAKAEPNRRGFFVGALEPAFKSAAGGEEIRWSEVEFFPTHDVVVQRYQALQSHGLVRPLSAYGYCQGALEQRGGRGRPRTYHHSCSGLAKREQDRARGKPRPRPRVPDTD